jgi:hypothetical protein
MIKLNIKNLKKNNKKQNKMEKTMLELIERYMLQDKQLMNEAKLRVANYFFFSYLNEWNILHRNEEGDDYSLDCIAKQRRNVRECIQLEFERLYKLSPEKAYNVINKIAFKQKKMVDKLKQE